MTIFFCLPLLESATKLNAPVLPHIHIVERPRKTFTNPQAKRLWNYYRERAREVRIQVSLGKAYPEDAKALDAKSLVFFERACRLKHAGQPDTVYPIYEASKPLSDDSIDELYEDTSRIRPNVFYWSNGNVNANDDYAERFIQPLYDDMYGDY